MAGNPHHCRHSCFLGIGIVHRLKIGLLVLTPSPNMILSQAKGNISVQSSEAHALGVEGFSPFLIECRVFLSAFERANELPRVGMILGWELCRGRARYSAHCVEIACVTFSYFDPPSSPRVRHWPFTLHVLSNRGVRARERHTRRTWDSRVHEGYCTFVLLGYCKSSGSRDEMDERPP